MTDTFLRHITTGAGFPLFATAMYNYLGVGWASSTLAFISIAFIPIPFVLVRQFIPLSPFLPLSPSSDTLLTRASLDMCICMYANNSFFQYKYGATLRKNHSKYARKDI